MSTQLTLNIPLACQERDKGIEQAVNHANAMIPDWAEKAYAMFKSWLSGWAPGYRFMIEDFRKICQIKGLPDPPHNRAFGSIAVRAKKDGLVKSAGIKKVTNVKARRCFATEWEKI